MAMAWRCGGHIFNIAHHTFNAHAGLWEKLYSKLFLSTQVYHGHNAMVEGDGGGGGDSE